MVKYSKERNEVGGEMMSIKSNHRLYLKFRREQRIAAERLSIKFRHFLYNGRGVSVRRDRK